jgi:drug/metabolite transporter (DMT)-like permease
VLAATLLALGSAGLHAFWNLLVKTSDRRFFTAWGQFVFGGVLFFPVLIWVGLPPASVVGFLLASSVIHVAYTGALVRAYHHGDFSFAYPLARGSGAFVAALGGVVFPGDYLPPLAWVAIAIVVAGLLSLVNRSVTAIAVRWALLTAVTIGTYTTIDAEGARRSSTGFSYGLTLIVGIGLALSIAGLLTGQRRAFVDYARNDWKRLLAGGAAASLAYCMVLAGVRLAPVGYVASLRESSVVLGALAGWLFLHEKMGRHRVVSSCVVAVGLILLIVWR